MCACVTPELDVDAYIATKGTSGYPRQWNFFIADYEVLMNQI